jgi:hypothetical protein
MKKRLLACALLAAGCSHPPPPTPQAQVLSALEEARGELRSIIADPVRAARADALLERLREVVEKAGAQARVIRARLDDLDRHHDATADQFRAVLVASDTARDQHRHAAVAIRDQLARLLTGEEWEKSAAVRHHLLELQLGPQPL